MKQQAGGRDSLEKDKENKRCSILLHGHIDLGRKLQTLGQKLKQRGQYACITTISCLINESWMKAVQTLTESAELAAF